MTTRKTPNPDEFDAQMAPISAALELLINAALQRNVPVAVIAAAGGQTFAALVGHMQQYDDATFQSLLRDWLSAFESSAWEHRQGQCERTISESETRH
jgi:hypothetical protein